LYGENGRVLFELTTSVFNNIKALQVERNIDLVYGGGSIGLMGLISRAVYDGGRHVLGYPLRLPLSLSLSLSLSIYIYVICVCMSLLMFLSFSCRVIPKTLMPREVLEFLFCDKKKLKKKRKEKEKEKEESIYDIPVAGIINSTLFDCFDNKHFIHKVNFSTDFFFFFPL
jgi:hypothetical protein